jgi:hypothetical protein
MQVVRFCIDLALPLQTVAGYEWEASTPPDVVQLCLDLGLPGKLLRLCTWLMPVARPVDLQWPEDTMEIPFMQRDMIYKTWFMAYRTLVAMSSELKLTPAQERALLRQLMGGNSKEEGDGELKHSN